MPHSRLVRSVLAAGLLVWISGCASSPVQPGTFTQTDKIDEPPLDVTSEAGLGETLIRQGLRISGPALVIDEPVLFNKSAGEASLMTCGISVPSTRAWQRGVWNKGGEVADCFGPVSASLANSDGSTNWNCSRAQTGDVCRSRIDNDFFFAAGIAKFELKQATNALHVEQMAVSRPDNFLQEFIYNGRVGNSVKFIYREFSQDMARPAFTQEVQYDLSESAVIGFRDLRIRVFSATNTEIRYEVLAKFN